MAKGLVSRQYLEEIAEAIRLKRGTTEGTDTEVVLSVFAASVEQLDENTAVVEITDARGTTRASIKPNVAAYMFTRDEIIEMTPFDEGMDEGYYESQVMTEEDIISLTPYDI